MMTQHFLNLNNKEKEKPKNNNVLRKYLLIFSFIFFYFQIIYQELHLTLLHFSYIFCTFILITLGYLQLVPFVSKFNYLFSNPTTILRTFLFPYTLIKSSSLFILSCSIGYVLIYIDVFSYRLLPIHSLDSSAHYSPCTDIKNIKRITIKESIFSNY